MTRFYVVTASFDTEETDAHGVTWTRNNRVPTFYLNADIQGILDEAGAERVASRILEGKGRTIHAHAIALDAALGVAV
jgi:hypothetical protein